MPRKTITKPRPPTATADDGETEPPRTAKSQQAPPPDGARKPTPAETFADDLGAIDAIAVGTATPHHRRFTTETSQRRFADVFGHAIGASGRQGITQQQVLEAEAGKRQKFVDKAIEISNAARQLADDDGTTTNVPDAYIQIDDWLLDLISLRDAGITDLADVDVADTAAECVRLVRKDAEPENPI